MAAGSRKTCAVEQMPDRLATVLLPFYTYLNVRVAVLPAGRAVTPLRGPPYLRISRLFAYLEGLDGGVEQAVDEGRALGGAEALGQLHGLVDGHPPRDVGQVQHL